MWPPPERWVIEDYKPCGCGVRRECTPTGSTVFYDQCVAHLRAEMANIYNDRVITRVRASTELHKDSAA